MTQRKHEESVHELDCLMFFLLNRGVFVGFTLNKGSLLQPVAWKAQTVK